MGFVKMDKKHIQLVIVLIVALVVLVVLISMQPPAEKPIGGDKDEHGCLIAAGYSWCEAKQKCLRTWEEPCEVGGACTSSGGTVEKGMCCKSAEDFPNLCLIGACGCGPADSHEVSICNCGEGKCWDGEECVSVVNSFGECVAAGYPIMESYPRQCSTPDGRTFTEEVEACETMYNEIEGSFEEANYCGEDADCKVITLGGEYVEFGCYKFVNIATDEEELLSRVREYNDLCLTPIDKCAPSPAAVCSEGKCIGTRGGESCGGMSLSDAIDIAENSDCTANGTLKDTHVCNDYTRTWWLDLDIEQPGCAPACVINVDTEEAEINWRCTGLIPE
jgi:hypothetical protein